MKRPWGPTGAGGPSIPRLSSGAREQIELFLEGRNIEVPDPDGFFGALASGISIFDSSKPLGEESRPAAVRENLRRAKAAALRLNNALNKLDGNSRQLLGEVVQGGVLSLYDNVKVVIRDLHLALQLANEFPSSGSLPEHNRLYLAVDVANAIETHLNVTATSTKDGLFVEILEAVVGEATGKEAKALHELARKAVKYKAKVKWEGPDGVAEYVPPLDTT